MFARCSRSILWSSLLGTGVGTAVAAERLHSLPADGVADRAYRLWFNAGQSRVDRSSAVGAAVGGTSIMLWVAGQGTGGVALLPAAAVAMGFGLGTVAGVGMEVATAAVQRFSGRAEELGANSDSER